MFSRRARGKFLIRQTTLQQKNQWLYIVGFEVLNSGQTLSSRDSHSIYQCTAAHPIFDHSSHAGQHAWTILQLHGVYQSHCNIHIVYHDTYRPAIRACHFIVKCSILGERYMAHYCSARYKPGREVEIGYKKMIVQCSIWLRTRPSGSLMATSSGTV